MLLVLLDNLNFYKSDRIFKIETWMKTSKKYNFYHLSFRSMYLLSCFQHVKIRLMMHILDENLAKTIQKIKNRIRNEVKNIKFISCWVIYSSTLKKWKDW